MRKISITITALFASAILGFAQDINFSQASQTALIINPALTGVFDGWERVTINQRNQWLGGNTRFSTTALSADATFGKTNLNDRAHLGVGVFMYADQGGDGNFGTKQASVSLSGILPVGGGHVLSAGLQGGVGFRNAFIYDLTFENQWNGEEFDENLANGENGSLNSFIYPDVSAGFNWVYDGNKSTFARNEDTKFMLGFAIYHVNAPKLKYVNGFSEQLYRRFSINTQFIREISGSDWLLDASAIQFIQGPHYQTLVGLMAKYRFKNGTKITGNNQDAYFGFGAYARIKDAIIPSFMIDYKGFQFGLSYDLALSALKRIDGAGTIELSLSYRNLNHALFKRRRFY